MSGCKRYEILFKIVPFKSWQYVLLDRHLLRCPACLENLAGAEEAKLLTIAKDQIGDLENVFPQTSLPFKKQERKPALPARPFWRWAVGTLGVLAVAVAAVLVLTRPPGTENLDLRVKLRVDYIKIYGQPAQAYIFQTQDENSTFVWAEKSTQGEMP
jgi:hypothetical protein